MKKISLLIALFVSVCLLTPVGAFAGFYAAGYSPYTYGSYSTYNPYGSTYVPVTGYYNNVCTSLTSNMSVGSRDSSTGGQVSALQNFLISQDYLGSVVSTGYFGSVTKNAVIQFQYNHQLSPTGYVDVATRAAINDQSCGSSHDNNYYNYGNGYYNNYNNNYNNYYTAPPVISSLSTYSAAIGTSVTIYGSGFDYTNNTVNFNNVGLAGLSSVNGTSITFTVPSQQLYNNVYGNYNNVIGTYPVTVTTSHGTSNAINFSVTNGGSNYCNGIYYNNGYNNTYNGNCYNNGNLSISSISGPTNLQVGTQGVWSFTLYNPNSNRVAVSVRWGDEGAYNYAASSNSQTSSLVSQQNFSFSHVYRTSGNYTVVFTATNDYGVQTTASASVNVSGSIYNQQISLSYISPNSGRVGTGVTLYGAGFTPTGNIVHFGNGGSVNLYSANGTNIFYTIPSYLSGCDIANANGTGGPTMCAMYAQLVTPGAYPVYVSNSNGQTSTLYFTVTQ